MVVSPACVGMAGSPPPPGGALGQSSHGRVGTVARLPATPSQPGRAHSSRSVNTAA